MIKSIASYFRLDESAVELLRSKSKKPVKKNESAIMP
jgi:hypothetical protein